MKSDIMHQAKNHLLEFLEKVEEQRYTRSEYENFLVMTYQTPELEEIRVEVCNIIALSNKEPGTLTIREDKKEDLRELIGLLKGLET